ncbi:MAG: LAGLIDADG family homing endonuclease [Candidatus Aenigmarchaeota archaeon]|nr:LAGLIDADG family homing endonuclease [Candidatus Aenigmarchaeota archaeon]
MSTIKINSEDFLEDNKNSVVTFNKNFLSNLFSKAYYNYKKKYNLWYELGLKVDDRGPKGKRCSQIHKIYKGKPIPITLLQQILRINKLDLEEITPHIESIGEFRTHKSKMLRLPASFKFDYTLGRIIGHLHGDGCISGNLVNYSNTNKRLVKFFQEEFKKVFDFSMPIIIKSKKMYSCSTRNKNYVWLVNRVIGKMDNKILSSQFNRGFYSAIFDDEGSVTIRNRYAQIFVGMNNERIVNDMRNWLIRNGIKASILCIDTKFRKNNFYYFYVFGKQFKDISRLLDVRHEKKLKKLKTFIRGDSL